MPKKTSNIDIYGFIDEMEAICEKYDVTLTGVDCPILIIIDNKTFDQYSWLLYDYYNEL
jgi:hypothetical protein